MQYLIAIVFIIVFSVFDNSLGFSIGSPLYTHLTYMFQHASVMHLILNSFSFIIMFKILSMYANKYKLLFVLLMIGFCSSFLSEHDLPTVGASSMVYAMVGIMYGLVCRKILEFENKDTLIINVVPLLIAFIVSYVTKNSNFAIHLISLVWGVVVGVVFTKFLNK